ncbi:hypothetical protein MMC25_007118 [Agyrium rufum]|nr:hypothetical protein [Agyrium rufum]
MDNLGRLSRQSSLTKRRTVTILSTLLTAGVLGTFLFFVWSGPSIAKLKVLNQVPHPHEVTKALVMAKTRDQNVAWAYALMPDWIPYIYTADKEPGYPLHMPNKGREAMAYLSFIVDYYHALPAYTAFVHSASYNWHNDVPSRYTENIIKALRLEAVAEQGYVNLRCDQTPGCPTSVFPHDPTAMDLGQNGTRAHMVDIYQHFFGGNESAVPKEIGGVCCAQFALTRERIRQRPKEDYVRMRQWALDADYDSFSVGWVFEKVWHVIFGEEAVHCPEMEQCRCDLYGLCDE